MSTWIRYTLAIASGIAGVVFIAISVVIGVSAWDRGPLLVPGVLTGSCGIATCLAGYHVIWRLDAEPLFRWAFQIVFSLGASLFIVAIFWVALFGRSTFESPDATNQWLYFVTFGAICLGALLYIRRRGAQAIPSD